MASENIAMCANLRKKGNRNRYIEFFLIPHAKNLVRMFHARFTPITKTTKKTKTSTRY